MAAFFATRDDLRTRRRQLMKSVKEMPSALFSKAKAQLDEERLTWRLEGEVLKKCLESREQRKAKLGYDPAMTQESDPGSTAPEILEGISGEWRDGILPPKKTDLSEFLKLAGSVPKESWDPEHWQIEGADESDG
jgi:hypothetical protein